ncbi:kelch motif family protein [Stylonychia lemnae]|uniref:Kelch motif family protein n=1 Tax=Stylonychia lemnae TaxID=5949 RepID=A0A078ACA0_STYLE|nr:kelch motif family protein [Stylonychia lemnae]|eukprot:CDW79880.1 kelch motif family protein [Stylonychia lemnae]
MDFKIQKKLYLKEFNKNLEKYVNHPLHEYKPANIQFLAQGGQSKILSFYSENMKRDLVIKIYQAKYFKQAESEFNNMHLLDHENILQVYQIGTIYVEDEDQNSRLRDTGSQINALDRAVDQIDNSLEEQKSLQDGEGSQDQDEVKEDIRDNVVIDEDKYLEDEDDDRAFDGQDADYFIIMEKADCTLLDDIQRRRAKKQPYTSDELIQIWSTIINVFTYCQLCGISHNDIKPSNILLVKNQDGQGGINNYIVKISDFGTSMNVSETRNIQLSNKDMMFTNYNKFMTPLYASPSILQKADKINYYLEDVFSLGVTFLQMVGLFSSDELLSFCLNSKQQKIQLALSKSQTKLTHFHQQLLSSMITFDSEERPSFIELKDLMETPQLNLNYNNEGYIQALFKEKVFSRLLQDQNGQVINQDDIEILKISQQQVYQDIPKESILDYHQSIMNEQKDENQIDIGKRVTQQFTRRIQGATLQIRKLQNNVTKLICGIPQFEQIDYRILAKAVFQSNELLVLDFIKPLDSNALLKLYKPIKPDTQLYHKERPHIFSSDCVTTVTPEGQIFVMGGKYKCSFARSTFEIILDVLKEQFAPQIQTTKLPIAYRYMKNVGHYYFQQRRELLAERASFGAFSTRKEIYIVGGQDNRQTELTKVESYDIKRDAWKIMPSLLKPRQLPTVCMFRSRFLYVFGGLNQSVKDSFIPKTISTIERLDVREGNSWEVINPVKNGLKIKGHSLASLQISANNILIFGSYFKSQEPFQDKILYFTFDHEKSVIKDFYQNNEERDKIQDGSFTDQVITNNGNIYAINTMSSEVKSSNVHQFCIDDFTIQLN